MSRRRTSKFDDPMLTCTAQLGRIAVLPNGQILRQLNYDDTIIYKNNKREIVVGGHVFGYLSADDSKLFQLKKNKRFEPAYKTAQHEETMLFNETSIFSGGKIVDCKRVPISQMQVLYLTISTAQRLKLYDGTYQPTPIFQNYKANDKHRPLPRPRIDPDTNTFTTEKEEPEISMVEFITAEDVF